MLKYNVHDAINSRSHRKGLVNDKSLQFTWKEIQFRGAQNSFFKYSIHTYPANTYGAYYPKVFGKIHSQYPN